jgi:hypothetical protein
MESHFGPNLIGRDRLRNVCRIPGDKAFVQLGCLYRRRNHRCVSGNFDLIEAVKSDAAAAPLAESSAR